MILSPKVERAIVRIMLVLFIGMALLFSTGPILEGPNEVEHYRFVRYIVNTGELPPMDGHPFGQMHQTPLYYIVGAPLLALVDDPEFDVISERLNPYHGYEFAIAGNDNKNIHLHVDSDTDSGVATGVRLLRLYTIVLGTLTLIFNYLSFRIVFPKQPAMRLLALGIVAFWQQFVFMSSVINNDNMLFMTVSLSFYLALRQHRDGPTWKSAGILGLALGLALLSKSSAGMLVFPMAVATLIDRRTWKYAPLTVAVTVAVAGWWYIGNWITWGDPTGIQAMFSTWPTEIMEKGEVAWGLGLARAPYGFQSFWARFGYGAVATGDEVYTVFNILVVLASMGLLVWLVRQLMQGTNTDKRDWHSIQRWVIVVAFTLVWVLALIYSSSTVLSGNQGRYLMPGFGGWGILLALGLSQFIPRMAKSVVSIGIALILFGALLYSIIAYYFPSYAVDPASADSATALYTYEDTAQLLSVEPTLIRAEPGELVEVTLQWRALASTDRDLLTYIHTVDSELIRRDSYPAGGNFIAQNWVADDTWQQTYQIRIPEPAETQRAYPLIVGLYDMELEMPLSAVDGAGNEVTPFVGRIGIHDEAGSLENIAYRFGDIHQMTEPTFSIEDTDLTLCFIWQSLTETTVDYTIFLHLLDANNQIVLQQDFRPHDNHYPTSVWSVGEVIEDCETVNDVPNDVTQVAMGFYDPLTATRLPAIETVTDTRLTNDAVLIPVPNEES